MLVFTYFFLDDALLIHQKVGDHLSSIFMFNHATILDFGSRFVQLAVLAITGLFLLTIVAWAYFHGHHEYRKTSKDILLFIAALVFFGLLVDIVAPLQLGQTALFTLGLIEDGGELMVLSFILCYVFLLAIRKGRPNLFLHELMFKSKLGVVFDQ